MEKNLQTNIHIAVGTLPGVVMFRQNTGMGWAGRLIRKYSNGAVELADARPLHAGLCEGSSDLVGWKSIIVTPEMVGQRLAIFSALEVKTPKGRPSDVQLNFLRAVVAAGGIAKIVRDEAEAVRVLS